MKRACLAIALAASACPTPLRADNMMQQSPLLMRRAGPSCRPGDLGGSPFAGYGYALGPCAGADTSVAPNPGEARFPRGRRRP